MTEKDLDAIEARCKGRLDIPNVAYHRLEIHVTELMALVAEVRAMKSEISDLQRHMRNAL